MSWENMSWQEAVKASVRENRIVTIEHSDVREAALFSASEDCSRDSPTQEQEYWGVTVDGDEWRVHLAR